MKRVSIKIEREIEGYACDGCGAEYEHRSEVDACEGGHKLEEIRWRVTDSCALCKHKVFLASIAPHCGKHDVHTMPGAICDDYERRDDASQ